jgi:hypothetical protein
MSNDTAHVGKVIPDGVISGSLHLAMLQRLYAIPPTPT